MCPLAWPGHLLGSSVCSTDAEVGLKLGLFSTQTLDQVLLDNLRSQLPRISFLKELPEDYVFSSFLKPGLLLYLQLSLQFVSEIP